MSITYDKIFIKSVQKIPKSPRRILANKIALLEANPYDSRVHPKTLSTPLTGICSSRITREYRVLFRFIDPTNIFLIVAKHRKDMYR